MHQNYKFYILFFITFSNYFFAAHQNPEENIFIYTQLAKILRNTTSSCNKIQLFRNFLEKHPAYISTEQNKALPYCNHQTIAHFLVNENEFNLLHWMVFYRSENLATPLAKQKDCEKFQGSTAFLVLCCKLQSYRDTPTYNLIMRIIDLIKEKYPSTLLIARTDGVTPQQILDKHKIYRATYQPESLTPSHDTDAQYPHFCAEQAHCPYCGH